MHIPYKVVTRQSPSIEIAVTNAIEPIIIAFVRLRRIGSAFPFAEYEATLITAAGDNYKLNFTFDELLFAQLPGRIEMTLFTNAILHSKPHYFQYESTESTSIRVL